MTYYESGGTLQPTRSLGSTRIDSSISETGPSLPIAGRPGRKSGVAVTSSTIVR